MLFETDREISEAGFDKPLPDLEPDPHEHSSQLARIGVEPAEQLSLQSQQPYLAHRRWEPDPAATDNNQKVTTLAGFEAIQAALEKPLFE